MTDQTSVGHFIQTFFPRPAPGRNDRIRLRTLVRIRWVAVTGQLCALVVVHFFLGYSLPILPVLGLVLASALLNLAVTRRRSPQIWLDDREAAAHLGLDIIQLSLLLYLTGGLINPFALLILAPITVSATTLSQRSTILLGTLSITSISALSSWHLPLPFPIGALSLPHIYILGMWAALVLTIVLLATYNWHLAESARRMSQALSDMQMALAKERQLSALGALAAAAAHELGSPLSTISVVAKEISYDTPDDGPLAEDVALLISQSERCRVILAELAARPGESGDFILFPVSLSELARAAAEPYTGTSVEVVYEERAESPKAGEEAPSEPMVRHSPEFMHGMGGLVHNAVGFAAKRVVVLTHWSATDAVVEILDDGPGFPHHIIQRLGDPYLSTRAGKEGHMGLGIFISQTLLGQTGAVLSFGNRRNGGAVVTARWPRSALEAPTQQPEITLTENGLSDDAKR